MEIRMTARRSYMLAVSGLEDRVTPSISVLFDFRFDDTGFFTDNPERITTIRAAAKDVGDRFADELATIPFPSVAGDSWKAKFNRPSGVGQEEEVINLLVPANTIVVFVGARELFGDPIETSSSREYFGSVEWGDLVL